MVCLPSSSDSCPPKWPIWSLQNLDSCITPPNFKKFPSYSTSRPSGPLSSASCHHRDISHILLRGGRLLHIMSSFRTISRNAPPTSFPRASALNVSAVPYGRSPAYRRLISSRLASPGHDSHVISTSSIPSQLPPLRSQFLPETIRRAALSQSQFRAFSISSHSRQDVKSETKTKAESPKTEPTETGSSATEEQSQKQEEPQEESGEKKAEEEGEEGKKGEKKEDAPPPPPHGDKTPWQVFMETMQSEFKASKEWNDSTKQLAQGATDFVESENVRRAREAYEKTTGAVSSTAGKVLKGTAGAVGKGAAWTWDTPVMKGVRKAANVTGDAIDKTTKPIRDTEAYKSVKSVIDDGSSSRYGGWVEKEERRKQRELREQMENPNGLRKHEVLEEDPKYVGPASLPLFLS